MNCTTPDKCGLRHTVPSDAPHVIPDRNPSWSKHDLIAEVYWSYRNATSLKALRAYLELNLKLEKEECK